MFRAVPEAACCAGLLRVLRKNHECRCKVQELIEKGILLHSVDYGKIDELESNIEAAKKRLEEIAEKLGVEFEKEVMVGTASQAIIGTALAKKQRS